MLHEAVRNNVETYLAQAREATDHGFGVPRFVEKELRGFLRCGVLAHGFVRVRCTACGDDLLVGFSCKARAICPSCTARRAADCAAHLVDDVLPTVPVRQWVLTFPRRLRFALAKEPRLATKVIALWLRALETFHRRRARRAGLSSPIGGAVTFQQRFGSALNLNVHLHTVRPDGVFVVGANDERACFVMLRPPSSDEVEALLVRIIKRVLVERYFEGRSDDVAVDVLTVLAADNARAAGDDDPSSRLRSSGRHEAFLDGFSMHCGVHLHANDRQGIERLCRYGARGPVALDRLSKDHDGRFRYRMKRTVNGRDELVMKGEELVAKLAVLIPPPRVHMTRFHGCFAPNAKVRSKVVPRAPVAKPHPGEKNGRVPTYRLEWAALIKRVFAADVLVCARCDGKMRVIANIGERDVIERILLHLGLPAIPRAPPQSVFAYDAA